VLEVFGVSTAVLDEESELVHDDVYFRGLHSLFRRRGGQRRHSAAALDRRDGLVYVSVLHVSLQNFPRFLLTSLVQLSDEEHVAERVLETLDHHGEVLLDDQVGGVEHIGESLSIPRGWVCESKWNRVSPN
jgi:hypothetical protein